MSGTMTTSIKDQNKSSAARIVALEQACVVLHKENQAMQEILRALLNDSKENRAALVALVRRHLGVTPVT